MILSFQKNTDETNVEFINRIASSKEKLECTWQDIADTVNATCALNFSESYYRKHFGKLPNLDEYKELTKLRDENNEKRAEARRNAREETLIEIAHDAVQEMNKKYNLPYTPNIFQKKDDKYEGILLLSDWHYGIDIDSYFNVYNPEVAKERLTKLQNEVIDYVNFYKLNKLHVVNLGDLICGRIHLQLRLQSRIDVITQTMQVSELLSTLLYNLSKKVDIEYYDTLDNHSRLEPIKENSLELESLVRIITWYSEERLKDVKNIKFNKNTFADDIVNFKVFGHNVIAVHGHKDPPSKVIEQLSLMTKEHYDLVLSAHFHHFNADEQNETDRVGNGSLMGADAYAQDLRLTSKPSQTLIIATKDNVLKGIHKIIL